MKHARPDYERFQDPAGKIPEGEPVMLFRGQDVLAAATLRFYASQCELNGQTELSRIVRDQAIKMENWPYHKMPDLPSDMRGEIKLLNTKMKNVELVVVEMNETERQIEEAHKAMAAPIPEDAFTKNLSPNHGKTPLDPDRPFMEQMAEKRINIPVPGTPRIVEPPRTSGGPVGDTFGEKIPDEEE